jgi:hypothetical protein
MSGEPRRAHARIDVNRPVELAELDEFGAVVGYTKNLSEAGVRARFDVTPEPSANVMVRLFLEDGAEPIEKRGQVVWSAPDIYGDGTDVGLRLTDDDDEPIPEDDGRSPLLPEKALCVGQPIQISRAGISYDAVVAQIGEPDADGRISVVLSTAAEIDDAEPEESDSALPEEDHLDVEQWKPHPLRDVWNAIVRYGGPPARILLRAVVTVGAVCSRFFAWAWRMLPAGPRASAESLFRRMRRGLGRVRDRMARIASPLTSRLTGSRKE